MSTYHVNLYLIKRQINECFIKSWSIKNYSTTIASVIKVNNGLIIKKNQTGDLFLSNRLKTSFVEKKWKYSKQGTVEYFNDNSLFLIRSKVD